MALTITTAPTPFSGTVTVPPVGGSQRPARTCGPVWQGSGNVCCVLPNQCRWRPLPPSAGHKKCGVIARVPGAHTGMIPASTGTGCDDALHITIHTLVASRHYFRYQTYLMIDIDTVRLPAT